MEFASVLFIELFLPVVLIVYYLLGFIRNGKVKMTVRNAFLLVSSFVFYAFRGINDLLLFVGIIALNFFAGIVIGALSPENRKGLRRTAFIATLLANAGMLVFFKYTTMFASLFDMFGSAGSFGGAMKGLLTFSTSVKPEGIINIVMPLAFSFTVFQLISYISDIYLEKIRSCKNILTFALYMTLLAQVTQGPIMRFDNLGSQIEKREHTLEGFIAGLRRLVYGLGKKVLIANVAAVSVDLILDARKTNMDVTKMGAPIAWLGVILFTIQIYYDFSGYTDMAIGVGGMLGFKIDENFNYPYTALSVQEFWRRWHMSLSSWFKDYIYIPLGGSRKGTARACFNVALVFFITGIWHGANLTFLVWGLIFVIASVAERLFLGKLLKKNPVKPLNWLYTMLVVMVGWVFFRADNLDFAGKYIGQMFSFKGSAAGYSVLSYLSLEIIIVVIAGILFCGALQRPLEKPFEKLKQKKAFRIVELVFLLALFVFCIIRIVGGSYAPSIYENF